jgi:DNA-directed RNA polymerase subunit RPC12/RpoP
MVKHICSDCGARFHETDSWDRHWCQESEDRITTEETETHHAAAES